MKVLYDECIEALRDNKCSECNEFYQCSVCDYFQEQYQQGRADGYSQAEKDYFAQSQKDREDTYNCGYAIGRADVIDEVCKAYQEKGYDGQFEEWLFEQLKEQNK